MVGRFYGWCRSSLYRKLVFSHALVLALFLILAMMLGRFAFRAFSKLLFHENFIRQSTLLFHDLVDEIEQVERVGVGRRPKASGMRVRRGQRQPSSHPLSRPLSRPSSRPLSRPSSRPGLGRGNQPTTRTLAAHEQPGVFGQANRGHQVGQRWMLWAPVLQRHTRSASRFLLTLVTVSRPDGTCLFETYPPTLMDMMAGRRWPHRRGWKRLLRAPDIRLAQAREGVCQGMEQLQSVRHGTVYVVAKHTLYSAGKPFIEVRYHSLSPFRDRPPHGALLVPIGFVFGMAMLLVFPISRSITRSLRALTETVNKIQDGDLTQEVKAIGCDEVGQLAHAVEAMRSGILAHQEQRKALLSDVSHEIRTPLARVRTVAESVADGLMREGQVLTDAMEGICQQVDDIDQLLSDILDIARFGLSQANQLQCSSFSLQELLEEMYRALRPAAEAEQIELLLESLPAEPLCVRADRRRLRQVINNLVQNAMRYSPSGGEIRLALGKTGPPCEGSPEGASGCGAWAWIFVSDQGPGVPVEERLRIFERLVRLDASRSRHTGGQGLGLAIVSQIVDAHKGEVGVDEATEGGARFWVRLPLV